MYQNILLPLDLTEESSWKKALPEAVAYCQAFSARLTLLVVVPDFGMTVVGQFFPEGYEKKAVASAAIDLDAMVAANVADGVDVRTQVAYGTVYEEILSAAEKTGADLIIMGSHRPALRDYLLGPNAARVVRHADCSVLVVRD